MTAPKGQWKLSETHHGGYSRARKNGKHDLISFPKYHSKSTENRIKTQNLQVQQSHSSKII